MSTESVSQQDADQRAGDAAAKAAARLSAAANVARLQELESFKRVLAPFDGTVTQRNTDVGALINAGQSAGNALFRVADTHRLRIYVSVPQPYASAIHDGLTAALVFADRPGKRYEAQVANTAHALDAASRTLQVELQIDNAQGELLPGSYAQVYFTLTGADNTLRVPVNTVLFRTDGLQVAVLDAQHRVHLTTITQGRDFGTEIEVLSGVTADDVLVANPPDSTQPTARRCAWRRRRTPAHRRRRARTFLMRRLAGYRRPRCWCCSAAARWRRTTSGRRCRTRRRRSRKPVTGSWPCRRTPRRAARGGPCFGDGDLE